MNRLSLVSLIVITSLSLSACQSTSELHVWRPISTADMAQLVDKDKDGVIVSRDKCAETKVGLRVDNFGCPSENVIGDSYQLVLNYNSNQSFLDETQLEALRRFLTSLSQLQDWQYALAFTEQDPAKGNQNQQALARVEALNLLLNTDYAIEETPKLIELDQKSLTELIGSDSQGEPLVLTAQAIVSKQARKWHVFIMDEQTEFEVEQRDEADRGGW